MVEDLWSRILHDAVIDLVGHDSDAVRATVVGDGGKCFGPEPRSGRIRW